VFAYANMAPNDDRLLQYQGSLRSGGGEANGSYDFRFGLFISDADPNAAACLLNDPPNCALWSSEIVDVEVSAGRFAVTLGEQDAISDSVLAQDALYLAVAVKGDADVGFSAMSGYQRLVPVPLASRAAAARDFKVTGSVSGPLVVAGDVSTSGDVLATGDVLADGQIWGASLRSDGDVVAAGNVTASRMALASGIIQRGGATITGTADLGLYSMVAANWIRMVTNQAPFRFFTDGDVASTGSTPDFSIEGDGSLTWGFNETASDTKLLPDRFCVVVRTNDTTCPANWTSRAVKWDTEDSGNADSKDGVIAVDNGNTASVLMRFCCRGAGL
jgi:hypothetical protein